MGIGTTVECAEQRTYGGTVEFAERTSAECAEQRTYGGATEFVERTTVERTDSGAVEFAERTTVECAEQRTYGGAVEFAERTTDSVRERARDVSLRAHRTLPRLVCFKLFSPIWTKIELKNC